MGQEQQEQGGADYSTAILDELNKGIANIVATLDETATADTFWYRYWAGYLHGYEELRDKLRTAIAREAHALAQKDSPDV